MALVMTGAASAGDLETYRVSYEKNVEEIILTHRTGLAKLGEDYKKALDLLSKRVTKAGDLDSVKAVLEEIERFSKESTVFEADTGGFPDLKQVKLSYIQKARGLGLEKARKILSLAEEYDAALLRLQRSLTTQEKLNDATAVQETRKGLHKRAEIMHARYLLAEAELFGNSGAEPRKSHTGGTPDARPPVRPTSENAIDLETALDMFNLGRKGWRLDDDCLTGNAGYTARFYCSEPIEARSLSFGFKIKAKWYHGIAIKVDGTELCYSRGHLLNEKSGISIDGKWTWREGKVKTARKFVPMEVRLERSKVSWYYDGKLITKSSLPDTSLGDKTVYVGFACHKTEFQVKDFFLKKR